jgi:hypothetical protein
MSPWVAEPDRDWELAVPECDPEAECDADADPECDPEPEPECLCCCDREVCGLLFTQMS